MSKNHRLVPLEIFCPKCGAKLKVEEVKDPMEKQNYIDHGFDQGGKGGCKCGVVFNLGVKAVPKSPTFTIMFDVYKT